MLCLKIPSQQPWIQAACTDLEGVLLDHAHCEKKAAATAMALINRYPDKTKLVDCMAELAREEMEHFALVHQHLKQRGIALKRDPGDAYAQALHTLIRKTEPEKLLDQLLVAAVIEARSCERFQMLSQHVPDAGLQEFYRSLLASEAGHYRIFTDLAKEYFPELQVRQRLEQLALLEADIILNLANLPTMHG